MKNTKFQTGFNIRINPHSEFTTKIFQFGKAALLNSDYSNYKKSEFIFICGDHNRPWELQNRAYAPLIDPLFTALNHLGHRCISVAHHSSLLVGAKATHLPKSMTRSVGREYLSKILLLSTRQKHNLITFRNILSKTGAKKVIGIGAHPSQCYEARSLGIEYIEVLHGLSLRNDPFEFAARDPNTLPTSILAFDKNSYQFYKKLKLPNVSIHQGPHPGHEIFKNSTLAALTTWDDEQIGANRTLDTKRDRLSVLITTQWGYAGELPYFSGIIRNGFIDDVLLSAIKQRQDIDWQIRLHPSQYRLGKYRRIITFLEQLCQNNPNVGWMDATQSPLPLVLKGVDAHITMSSVSSYEAAHFGVPTMLLCPTQSNSSSGQNQFVDLVKTGHACVAGRTIQNINAWLDNVERAPSFELNDHRSLTWEQTVDFLRS